MSLIYEPAEDSFLLKKIVDELNLSGKVLEMGAGSGFICSDLKKVELTLVDINSSAVKILGRKFPDAKIIESDLFSNVSGKFEVIIFNPPYLPEDSREDDGSRLATTGGIKGGEVVNRFLDSASDYLEKKGKIILLTSSLTRGVEWGNWKKKLLGKKKLFMEELFVWELR